MNRLKQILECLFFFAFIALAIEAFLLVRNMEKELPHVDQLITDADRTTIIIAGTATNIEKSTRQWKDEASSQARAATQATIQLNTDLKSLDTLLDTANTTLVTQSDSFAALQAQTSKSINELVTKAGPSLDSLSLSTANLSQSLPPILKNINDASAQTVTIAQNTAQGTAELNATTHDIRQVADAFRNDYLKPRNRLYFYFKELLSIAAGLGDASKL